MLLDRQDAFDRAVTGILSQGQLAKTENGTCVYRADTDPASPIRCGVGWLIPDALYSDIFEGIVPHIPIIGSDDAVAAQVARAAGAETTDDAAFLERLQATHDNARDLNEFANRAADFAAAENLSTDALDRAVAAHAGNIEMTARPQQHSVADDVVERVRRAITRALVGSVPPYDLTERAARAAIEAVGQSEEGSITLDNASVQRLLDYGVLHYGENGWFVDASSPTPGEAE